MTARELLDAFARRELSPVEVLPPGDDPLGAFATWCLDRARAEARAAEAAWRRGEPTGRLCGLPFAAKDLFDTAGVETACGSRLLAGRVPERDAAAVARARAEGAVLVGKTATVEFAWGLMMRDTRNPADPARTAGGSSGGSAVAVATGAVPLALGSDTGGSVRLPAAFCGVVGFKPSLGAVPVEGCWPLAPSMDCAGPMAASVADAALLFEVLAGRPVRRARVAGLRVGVPRDVGLPLRPAVVSAVSGAAARLGSSGASVVPVDVPPPDAVMAAYAPTLFAEALAVHRSAGLWPARRAAYGAAVRRRLELAEAQPSEAVEAGARATEELLAAYRRVWQAADVLLTPACATAPPRVRDGRTDLREVASPLLCPANRLGLPSCAVPAGRDEEGLPVGVLVTGAPGADDTVLATAAAAAS